MHTHTRLCYCGGRDSTVANTVTEAESVGLRLLGISDHIDVLNSGREELIQQNRDELAQIDTSVDVLVGAEVSLTRPGGLPILPSEVAKLDYILVSANHFHLHVVQNPEDRTEEGYADWFLKMATSAIKLGASIIPHPFSYIGVRAMGNGRPPNRQRLLDAYERTRVQDLFGMAAERGTAFELNPSHVESCSEFFREIIPIARAEGAKFSIGSDGHHPGSMHYGGSERIVAIERLLSNIGITESDICQSFAPRLS